MSLNSLVSDIFLRLDELYLICHRFLYALRLSLILAKSDRALFAVKEARSMIEDDYHRSILESDIL